jgi:hypothetical protein
MATFRVALSMPSPSVNSNLILHKEMATPPIVRESSDE